MEHKFQNTTILDKKAYYSFVDFHYSLNWKGMFVFSLIIAGIIFPLIFGTPKDEYEIIGAVIGVVLTAVINTIWFGPLLMRRNFKRQALKTDKRLQTPMDAFYTFNDDGFGYTIGTNTGTVPYNTLYRVYESKKYFFLMQNSYTAYIIDRNGFGLNISAEQFSVFIAERLGKNFYNKSGKRKQIK